MNTRRRLAMYLEQVCAAGGCVAQPAGARQAETALLLAIALRRPPPAALEMGQARWLESLKLLANLGDRAAAKAEVERLLSWRGREAHWLWQWKFRLTDRKVRFDPRKYGWGWSPRTSSWVIPTALAVIALEKACEARVPAAAEAAARIERGKAMLLDRSCASGGWNAGNPDVYGVALKPHLDTTATALMALQDRREERVVVEGIRWLAEKFERCPSAYSVAWASLALATLGHETERAQARLLAVLDRLPEDAATAAVAHMALEAFEGENPFLVRKR